MPASPCGCGGAAARGPLRVSTDADGSHTVERAPEPGMPRYRVTPDGGGKATEFARWADARSHQLRHGGKLRAI